MKIKLCALVAITALSQMNAWQITTAGSSLAKSEHDFSSTFDVEGLSGITWAGGNTYYLVNDDGYIHTASITLKNDGTVNTFSVNLTNVAMKVGGDIEGIAYDPATGNVYVSNETGPTIKSYSTVLGAAATPIASVGNLSTLFKNQRSNKSLEALTISGDGLTMWTCNEEALTRDGPVADKNVQTTVRLTKFTRADLNSSTWTFQGQWAYTTDGMTESKALDRCSRGVSALAALPDGTLLVLERDCCADSKVSAYLSRQLIYESIYSVSPDQFTSEKDIRNVDFTNTTITAVQKSSKPLWGNIKTGAANYEGMCLGPRLPDGSTSLLLVSDGDVSTVPDIPFVGTITLTWDKKILALKLTGGSIVSLDSSAASVGAAYPPGGPYRYLENAAVTVSLAGVPENAYDTLYTVNGCSYGANGAGATAAGNPATLTLTADHTTVNWQIATASAFATPRADSFENYADGLILDNIHGWTGDGVVTAQSYTPPTPPGYALPAESHTKVLNLSGDDGATRVYDFAESAAAQLDLMFKPTRYEDVPDTPEDNPQVALAVAKDGALLVYHGAAAASAATPGWTKVTAVNLGAANGVWARASLAFDYSDASASFVQVRVNGSLCPSPDGFAAPALASPRGGAWYRCAANARKINAVHVSGTGALDDVVATNAAQVAFDTFPHTGGATNTVNNFAYEDLYAAGLAWDTPYDADGDGKSALVEAAMGSDPDKPDENFAITGITHADDTVTISFLGNLTPFNRFILLGCENLDDGWETLATSDEQGVWTLDTESEVNTNTWSITTSDLPAKFFRVKAAIRK